MFIRISENARLYHADCRDAIRELPDNSIDSVVTDPPYALVSIVKRFGGPNAAPAKGNDAYMRASAGFMGKQWDTGEVAFSEEFWAEVLRVLKPGGHVAAFGASRGYHRMACAIEDAGFEIRDSLMWVYGTGFPKGLDVSKQIDKALGAEREVIGCGKNFGKSRLEDGKNALGDYAGEWDITAPSSPEAIKFAGFSTALKPAFEPIVLGRKPLSEGTVAANVLRWGTGALNIDGCRVPTEDATGRTRNSAFGLMHEGRDKQGGVACASVNQGRWPANVCHDGSDEVVGAFPVTKPSSGHVRHNTPEGVNKEHSFGRSKENWQTSGPTDSGSAARFFYSAKASKADRAGSKHPTVKPIALMQWLARLITPPGGVILDPFAGSGTTGAAALAEGFKAVLCEREDEYVEDIRRRLSDGPDPLTRLLRWNRAVSAYRAQVAA